MSALAARVGQLEKASSLRCESCADWPDIIPMRLVEELVEVDGNGNTVPVYGEQASCTEEERLEYPRVCKCCGREVRVVQVVEFEIRTRV